MTQAQALTILKTGANVFLTGEPGAGKTYVINRYVEYLREHGIEPAITASTGIAATHLHGQTIHSWAGIGVRKQLTGYDLDALATTEYLAKRINGTKVLIIDEISMIDAATLDMVDAVCRTMRNADVPFGGMQVILVGDFFQLPPVSRAQAPSFAFDSQAWKLLSPLVCYLSEQHRQSDERYLSILSAIRANEYDEMHHDYLQDRFVSRTGNEAHARDGTTRLYSHNADVDTLNAAELEKLPGIAHAYPMQSKGKESMVAALKKGCLSPERLELKVGAIVMCTKNNRDKGYVNGTLGAVIGFDKQTTYPLIKIGDGRSIMIEPSDWNIEENGKIKASITQLPLRLAWAITIHKSQGMSLDAAVMDLSEVFEYGQGYVALSRVRSLAGLHLLGTNARAFEVHPRIREEDGHLKAQSSRASAAFADIEDADIEKMQTNFLTAIGGSIAKGKKKAGKGTGDTLDATLALVNSGETIAAIAKARGMTEGTIIAHIEKLVDAGRASWNAIEHLLPKTLITALPDIDAAFKKVGSTLLAPVREALRNKYSFETLRLARLALSVQQKR